MKNSKLLLLLFLFPVMLSGCGDEEENAQQKFDLVASEKNLPAEFHEMAFKRKETPFFQYLVRNADNQLDFEDIWNFYEFENQAPKLDFDKKIVFFIGVQESGSCPYKIEMVEPSYDNKTLTIDLLNPDGACNSDATPRTFVIQMEKEESKDIESIVIVDSGAETRVPLENWKFPK